MRWGRVLVCPPCLGRGERGEGCILRDDIPALEVLVLARFVAALVLDSGE
jgi:hypothetical protein